MPYIADATNVLTPADGDYIVNGPAEIRAIKVLLAATIPGAAPISFSQTLAISSNTTLTASQSGAYVILTALVTLPAAVLGLRFKFIGGAGGGSYQSPAGGAWIFYPDGNLVLGGSAIPLNTNSAVELVCDGHSWIISDMTGDIVVFASGTANRAVNTSQIMGWLQTYTDVTATRVSGTNYFNGTGKPIVVYAQTNSGVNYDAHITATINGVTFNIGEDSNSSGGCVACGSLIVPFNTFYMLTAGGVGVSGFNKWVELK